MPRLKIPCNTRPRNNFAFAFQLMAVGLLNTAGVQNLKYQDQGIFITLEAVLYPTVLEISMYGVKLRDISSVI